MPRLSREPSDEMRTGTVTASSSLLQERLQRERNERQAGKQGSDLSTSTGDIRERDVHNSPIKRSATAMGQRQRPDGSDELAKDAGMGARQMEEVGDDPSQTRSSNQVTLPANIDAKTLSTLHKQNFDLKVELYHRRERQNVLEERVEKLETDYKEMMNLHESMISELEAKDQKHKQLANEVEKSNKAVAEAVTLIVELETQVDELLREREMVRKIEADGAYRHSHSPSGRSNAEPTNVDIPKMQNLSIPGLTEGSKGLSRMPSFLSERSEHTENLRNIILKGQNSMMRMRTVSESSVDPPSEINRIASPLSVLSESSFVSVYGPKAARDNTGSQPPSDVAGMDGSYADCYAMPTKKTSKESWGSQKTAAPGQMPANTPGGGVRVSTHMQSLNNVIDMNSPLQKLERLEGRPEGQMMTTDHISGQPIPSRGRGAATPTPRSQGKSKHEKREALQKVLTNQPTHRDFANPHAFPPTPDTVSSTTLRKHQNLTSSQDSLSKQAGIILATDKSGTSARELTYQTYPEQQTYTTAFSGRRQMPMPTFNPNRFSDLSQLAQSLPPRPHSAAETAFSRSRTGSIGSDSDSDGGADAHSEADSFDYWMKESEKPNRYQVHSSGQRGGDRSSSPDLFSFPEAAQGWETDVIFGALRGSGYLGSPVAALKRDPLDQMASSLQSPQAEVFEPPINGPAPPTPDRRSSLHARTGSTSAAPSFGGKLRKNPAKGPSMSWMDARTRSNSIDSAAQAASIRAQPQQPEALTTTPGKRSHYPPISGQAPRGRGLGLNSFFRRSGSESYSVPSSATEATFPIPTPNQLPPPPPTMPSLSPTGRSSVPPPLTMPWRPPVAAEDDYKSATPPPIMRSRGMSLLGNGNGGVRMADPATPPHPSDEMETPRTPTTVIPPHAGNTSTTPGAAPSTGRRKWLGLGRMGSTKNR